MLDIDVELADVAGILNAQHARLVEIVARALETGEWSGSGIHSPTQWLAWRTGLSPHRAQEIVRMASKRAEFPVITGAFDRGELAIDQVSVVMRAPSWADSKLLDYAKAATVQQLRRTIRSEYFEGDPAETEHAQPVDRDRLSTGHTESGRWSISGELDIDRGSIVDAALAEAKSALFERGDTDATWADAFVEVCERSLGAVASRSRRDRYRTWIHLEAVTGDATLTAGWRIPDAIRDHIMCDGVIQPVWEREGVPFNAGRTQYIVPDRLRRIVERRDRGCRVPGCTNDRFVEAHHIVPWLKGGTTATPNLLNLCPKHHRTHHQGKLGIAGNADAEHGVAFTDWMARVIGPNGQPVLPTCRPPAPESRYEHPAGERLQPRWVGLGWIHPNVLETRRQQGRTRVVGEALRPDQ